jgi:hypothetical protein
MKLQASAFTLLSVLAHAVAAGERSSSGAVGVVAKLYRDYAWEAVIDEPSESGKLLLDQPRQVLEHYFTRQLSELIIQDRACKVRTKEPCKLDFDPIWGSQDPGASDMKIKLGAVPNTVNVQFRYPGNGSFIEMTYRLRKGATGWRISDVQYTSGQSLVGILK